MTNFIRISILAVSCSLLASVSASAQVGKRPDPESPAGIEYQLPLDQARKIAGGGGGGGDNMPAAGTKPGRQSATAHLFGAGIAARGGRRAAAESDGADGAGSGGPSRPAADEGGAASAGGSGGDTDAENRSGESPEPEVQQAAVGAPDKDEGSAALQIGLIALGVLIAGALLGLGLRRGFRSSES